MRPQPKPTDLPCVGQDLVSVTVVLTDEEVATKTEELTRIPSEMESMDERHKEIRATLKAEHKALTLRHRSLALAVATRQEEREVPCTRYLDAETGTVFVVRDDTGETVRRVEANDEDMEAVQAAIPFPVVLGAVPDLDQPEAVVLAGTQECGDKVLLAGLWERENRGQGRKRVLDALDGRIKSLRGMR